MNLKNSCDSTGFEPMTSAMPVQCPNQLSYEVTQWRAGQFVGLMFPVKGMSCIYIYIYCYIYIYIQACRDELVVYLFFSPIYI